MNRFTATIISYIPLGRKSPPDLRQGRTLTGYGRVNCWASGRKKDLRRDLIECAVSGVSCYHIELAGWSRYSIFTDANALNRTKERYEWIVKRCRALGLWLFVSVVNDNMGKGKYGDTGPTLEKAWGTAIELLNLVHKFGKKNVIVQPVAETNTPSGSRFENECKAKLAGWTLVYNGSGGQPKGTNGMAFAAYHASSIDKCKSINGGFINSSDHGLIIRELASDGSLDGPGDPAKLKRLVSISKSVGNPLVVYYAFKRQKHDRNAIRALKP